MVEAIVTIVASAAAAANMAFGLGQIAVAVINTAIAVGVSYAAQALMRTQSGSGMGSGSPAAINAPEARGNIKQATPSQRVAFGECRIGGAMFFYEVKPPYLYVGFLYSSLPISEYLKLYIGERKVGFATIPENTIVSPIGIAGQPNYPGRLSVCVQHGSLEQGVNALIAADFPELGNRFMTPGVANAVFKCHYGNDVDEFLALWGNVQVPNFQWVVRGAPLPDPRVLGCRLSFNPRDPEDLFNAIKTWPYSDTAALAQSLWALLPYGLGAGPDRIVWDRSAEAANFDEEPVGLKDGGTQRRHVVSGVANLSDQPNVVMEALFTANRGFASQRAGRFSVFSSQPREPVLTITDAMLIGGFDFRNMKPKKQLVNIGRCKFTAPDREYQDADGPVLRYEDLIEADGEEFEQSVRFSFTPTHPRAQRLLKGYVSDVRLGRFLTCTTTMRCYGLREGDIVRRFSETGRYSIQDGLYSVEEWQLAENRSAVGLALAEYDPAIARDWNPISDELTFAIETPPVGAT